MRISRSFPPWQIKSADGQSWIAFGVLAQAQAEWLQTSDRQDTSQNLFLRRLRAIARGQFGRKLQFFIETDSPRQPEVYIPVFGTAKQFEFE